MPRGRRTPPPAAPASYPEAVAQWQLDVRTEVKQTSSLPSAVFDACDPMIETQLAQTTEAMLACLQEPTLAATRQSSEGGEKRIEIVRGDELRLLPTLLRDGGEAPDLDAGMAAEYLTVLTDAGGSGHEVAATGARALLLRDFGIHSNISAEELRSKLVEVLTRAAEEGTMAAEAVDAQCVNIAAIVAVQGSAGREDEPS
jgi:hypothetical protein